jgi:16S rRNA (guanine527-N7)-methyltransferase
MQGVELIKKYFPSLSAEQHRQFAMLANLYQEWNEKINVISRKDIDELYERHVLHALGIAKVVSFADQTRVLDVGTGGGFPGIPLAILFPQCHFHLVDSIGKKIQVVKAVAEGIGLTNVTAQHTRAEEVAQQFDFVVSRAVTQITPFYNWVHGKFLKTNKNAIPNGILYLKGGDITEEFATLNREYIVYSLPDYFEELFFETKKVLFIPIK